MGGVNLVIRIQHVVESGHLSVFFKNNQNFCLKDCASRSAARNERASLVNNKIYLFLTCETVTVFLNALLC